MKHVLLAVAFIAVLFCASEALGQTPPPQPWYFRWLSPVTRKKLHAHDPRVCHCDECRRMRLAAGIEYQGLGPYPLPTPGPIPRRHVPPPDTLIRPPVYTPPKPRG
jgi:hypothetical protein